MRLSERDFSSASTDSRWLPSDRSSSSASFSWCSGRSSSSWCSLVDRVPLANRGSLADRASPADLGSLADRC
eukprot:scaffold73_cov252-Pinguiococcus_pyrenoidosus.AAC.12